MGSEDLVSTIEKVETHESDPTANGERDPWEVVVTEFSDLSEKLKTTYRTVVNDHGPTEQEIRDAFATLAGAWSQVAESVSTALQDPETREQFRDAASSLATAVGTTISELGVELAKNAEEAERRAAGTD